MSYPERLILFPCDLRCKGSAADVAAFVTFTVMLNHSPGFGSVNLGQVCGGNQSCRWGVVNWIRLPLEPRAGSIHFFGYEIR